jgi:RNA polymerase II-associated factor 1
MLQDETLYMDRDSQIKAIEKTFEDSKKTIDKHYSKPNVVPVEVLPVYPDFKVCFRERLILNHTVLTELF